MFGSFDFDVIARTWQVLEARADALRARAAAIRAEQP